MRTFPECYSCVLRQILTVMDLLELDPHLQEEIIKDVLVSLGEAPPGTTAPALSARANRIVNEGSGVEDPYWKSKRNSIKIALDYLPALRKSIAEAPDPLLQGLKVGAAGNLIDVVYAREYHLWEEVQEAIQQDLEGKAVESFREKLPGAAQLLYLADNAGEAVFDRAFIERLDLPVTYAVKGGATLNDATREDALEAGIDQVAEIIETGSDSPGTMLDECSEGFLETFGKAPLILAKGQANYETLDDQEREIFFLLRAKCPLIAQRMGVPHRSLVFTRGPSQGNPTD